ncbi:MAG: hypothetical protein ACOVPA_12495, partial [Rubrivivax sp.]
VRHRASARGGGSSNSAFGGGIHGGSLTGGSATAVTVGRCGQVLAGSLMAHRWCGVRQAGASQ